MNEIELNKKFQVSRIKAVETMSFAISCTYVDDRIDSSTKRDIFTAIYDIAENGPVSSMKIHDALHSKYTLMVLQNDESNRHHNIPEFKDYLWDEKLYGNILCEGAQGFWLDINYGNYPYVTSSNTLPYAACSLGFAPQFIRHIYGATKIYDTRSGIDPIFPENLLEDEELLLLVKVGEEFGTTTGRMRKTNWLNLDKLVDAVKISGTTMMLMSKVDVVKKINIYKLYHNSSLINFENFDVMKTYIDETLKENCPLLENITYSEKNELT